MSSIDSYTSLAIQAHCCQNLYVPSDQYPDSRPRDTSFPCHDTFQNGIIENGKPTTFYTAATNGDIEKIKNHQSNMSGFLSDESTVNFCKNTNGIFDANEYANITQTQPWRPPNSPRGTSYTYRENMVAFNVDWNALNDPKNADFKKRICDSEGNIKCAFGKVEKNTHWGTGGGNQYYITRDAFNEGVNRDVFKYDDDKTLKESNGTLVRNAISERNYKLMDAERYNNIDKQLSSCPDKIATTDIEKAKSLNEITPEKANQINSAVAPKSNYLTSPDPAFNYSNNETSEHSQINGVGSSNVTSMYGGGANAPNESPSSTYDINNLILSPKDTSSADAAAGLSGKTSGGMGM